MEKKKFEATALNRLMEALSGEGAKLVAHDDRPDGIVDFNGKRVGVEVRNILESAEKTGSAVKQFEAEQDLAIGRAREIYGDGPSLQVSVDFQQGEFRKKDRDRIANDIAKIVSELSVDMQYLERREWEPDPRSWHAHLNSVRVTRVDKGVWYRPLTGYMNCDVKKLIEHAVAEKEKLVPKYLEKCDECWLLIVADWQSTAAFHEFDQSAPELFRVTSSILKRIYLDDRSQITDLMELEVIKRFN